ncbi:DUF4232 domain-containing protein [Actinoplanes sp. NPDC023936]|uniref:DUF4232 domain-containing protein n=1 Tax=Actinoplanes sp. NPDC023936 TaxID=3154910 RepID=UPI00340548BB
MKNLRATVATIILTAGVLAGCGTPDDLGEAALPVAAPAGQAGAPAGGIAPVPDAAGINPAATNQAGIDPAGANQAGVNPAGTAAAVPPGTAAAVPPGTAGGAGGSAPDKSDKTRNATPAATEKPKPATEGADPATAPCSGISLTAQLRTTAPAKGKRTAYLSVVNKSTQPCALNGHPDLQLLDGHEEPVSTGTERIGTKKPVTLAPGAAAWSTLVWSTVAGPDEPATGDCQRAATILTVYAPPDNVGIEIPYSAGPVCQFGQINATPFSAKAPSA